MEEICNNFESCTILELYQMRYKLDFLINRYNITPQRALTAAAQITGITESKILGKGQTSDLAEARRLIAMSLVTAGYKRTEIGNFLHRDQSAITQMFTIASSWIKNDAEYELYYNCYLKILKGLKIKKTWER